MDRAACQQYIRGVGQTVPPPSCCMRCPYRSPEEMLWLSLRFPRIWDEWVTLERTKLDAWADRTDQQGRPLPNHGVKGANTALPEVLAKARLKYAHLSPEKLLEFLDAHRFSHGHCVKTAY
jgi:hypothetical protein